MQKLCALCEWNMITSSSWSDSGLNGFAICISSNLINKINHGWHRTQAKLISMDLTISLHSYFFLRFYPASVKWHNRVAVVKSQTNQNWICLLSIAFVVARFGRNLLVKVCCRYSFWLLWETLWLHLVTSHLFATVYCCQFWRMGLILIVQTNLIS